MNARTRDWLKSLNVGSRNPGAGWQGLNAPSLFKNSAQSIPTPQKSPPIPWIPRPLKDRMSSLAMPPPISNPMQQMSGRVGGIQTTANQTQPVSAILEKLAPPSQQKNNPIEALQSWLSPEMAKQLSQVLQEHYQKVPGLKQNTQFWKQSLPQNITKNLLRGKDRTLRGW